ncbi:MAG: polymerase sigma-B factor [Thermoleophilaceae bacterium]|jgi:RNA polymerase sigma-B factor|nr:polymerase sigma-B factor [Thermoleophilaceae bacterium]
MAAQPATHRAPPPGLASDAELLRRYHRDGDIGARQELIERHVAFVRRLAQRYARRGEQLEDLTQVGCVGLIKAIDRFDGGFGASLTTYAAPNILGEIKRHFRDRGWSVRVPREIQELNVRLTRTIDELTTKLGRSPSVEELAGATSTTPEQVLEALESSAAYSAMSLSDGPSPDEEGGGPMDTLGADDDSYERSEQRLTLATGIQRLPSRERTILHLRFFEGLTQSEIAERMGMSQMHVSRLIRNSLDRMRDELESGT